MKKKLLKILLVLMVVLIGFMGSMGVYAQVREADSVSIDGVNVYRNCLEFLDQLYLVKYDIQYTTIPERPVNETYLVRLRNGAAELATVRPYAYFNDGYALGYASIYFTSATAPAWEGAYNMDIIGNPTLQWMDSTAITAMEGAVSDNATGMADETTEANSAVVNDMHLLSVSPQIDDAYYFGSTGMFGILTINLGTQGDWTGTGVWEYWNGAIWEELDSVVDNTIDFEAVAGVYDVTFEAQENWQPNLINGLLAYWIRYRVTTFTAIVTQPLGTQSWVNTIDPPFISTGVFTEWYEGEDLVATSNKVTQFLRTAAVELQSTWPAVRDLVITVAGVPRLSPEGEDYFTNVIPGLRTMAPELFADVLTTPAFPERYMGGTFYIGGDNSDNSTFDNNWFAQTFTPTITESINGVWLKGYRVGDPNDITVAVRATVGSLPTGADLVSGSINGSVFTADTDGDWYQWTFSEDQIVVSGTEYSLVVRASTGDATNYFAWRKNTAGTYADGQMAYSINSGVAWTANVSEDFIFQTTVREGWSASLRNRLGARLIGTRFDMTQLGINFGLSRMWMTGIVWLVVSVLVAWGATRGSKSYKLAPMIMMFMFIFGGMAGFLYLEISVLSALLSGSGGVYVLFYKSA